MLLNSVLFLLALTLPLRGAQPSIEDTNTTILSPVPIFPDERRGSRYSSEFVLSSLDIVTSHLDAVPESISQAEREIVDFVRNAVNEISSIARRVECKPDDLNEKAEKSVELMRKFPNLDITVVILNLRQMNKCLRTRQGDSDAFPSLVSTRLAVLLQDTRKVYEQHQLKSTFRLQDVLIAFKERFSKIFGLRRFDTSRDYRIALDDAFWTELVEPCAVFEYVHGDLIDYYNKFMVDEPTFEELSVNQEIFWELDPVLQWTRLMKICQTVPILGISSLNIMTVIPLTDEKQIGYIHELWDDVKTEYRTESRDLATNEILHHLLGECDISRLEASKKIHLEECESRPNVCKLMDAAFIYHFNLCVSEERENFLALIRGLARIGDIQDLDEIIWFARLVHGTRKLDIEFLDDSTLIDVFLPAIVDLWEYKHEQRSRRSFIRRCRTRIMGRARVIKDELRTNLKHLCKHLMRGGQPKIMSNLKRLFAIDRDLFKREAGYYSIQWMVRTQICSVLYSKAMDSKEIEARIKKKGEERSSSSCSSAIQNS